MQSVKQSQGLTVTGQGKSLATWWIARKTINPAFFDHRMAILPVRARRA